MTGLSQSPCSAAKNNILGMESNKCGGHLQITILPAKAEALIALADRLDIKPVAEVVEKYLVSQIDYENAIDALLLYALLPQIRKSSAVQTCLQSPLSPLQG